MSTRHKKQPVIFLFLIFAGILFSTCRMLTVGPADLVILNANVLTIDTANPRAEAIAFKGEKILAVSSTKAIERYIEEGVTRVIDAQGRLVVPGFNDAHVHFRGIDPDYIDLRYITDPSIITERVREKVAQSNSGELIRGGRWEHEMFNNKKWPTKELIDSVSPDNPVVLSRADGHSSLVNSYVLRQSGITKDTPDPPGGEIQKDKKTGEPTGIIKELARRLLKYGAVEVERSPEELEAKKIREWQAALDMAARLGVTTVHLPPGNFDMFQKFREIGKLTLRAYVGQRLDGLTEDMLEKYAELLKKYPLEDNWIRFGFLKGHIDGTLGSGTALFFEPFEDEPDKSGLPFQSYEELERIVVAADPLHNRQAICRKKNRARTLPGSLCLETSP